MTYSDTGVKMTDEQISEQMNKYYADRCDYRNGDNEDGIHYDLCAECFRYDICYNAMRNKGESIEKDIIAY